MFKKLGRAFKGFGKKLNQGFKAAKGFGRKVMRGLDDIGVGDVAREAGRELQQAGRSELERRGVNVAGAENIARQAMSAEGRRGLARQGAQRGLSELRGRLGRR